MEESCGEFGKSVKKVFSEREKGEQRLSFL